MTRTSPEFQKAVRELGESLDGAIARLPQNESTKLLLDILRNQLTGIEMFYELLLLESETGKQTGIDDESFDDLTKRYRALLPFFRKFPGANESSTYEMSVITDFYYILRNHTQSWG